MNNAMYHGPIPLSNLGLRRNRYQSQLFTDLQLRQMAPAWAMRLDPLYKAWKCQQIKPADVAGLYLLHSVETRLPGRWLGGRAAPLGEPFGPLVRKWFEPPKSLERWISPTLTLGQLLSSFHIRGVRQVARDVLCRWMKGEYPLTLTDRVPTAEEILNLQIAGGRWVTTVFLESELCRPVHDGRDALSFLLHDLGHAGQFFGNPRFQSGQIGSYRLLAKAQAENLLLQPGQYHSQWQEHVHYFLSDLNTHPVHFWAVFWARAREGFGHHRKEEYLAWRDRLFGLWRWPDDLRPLSENLSHHVTEAEAESLITLLLRVERSFQSAT